MGHWNKFDDYMFKIIVDFVGDKSMALCKTTVTPLLMHWSYCSLALSQQDESNLSLYWCFLPCRFQHHVFEYKGATVSFIRFEGHLYCVAVDQEWRSVALRSQMIYSKSCIRRCHYLPPGSLHALGHPSLFHTATSRLSWHKMAYMEEAESVWRCP